MEKTVKEKIKEVALKLFSDKGYYGTSIRDIAKEVECSLPTVYYYFKNKEELYEELAYKDFLELNQRLRNELQLEEDVQKMYLASVLQRINLQGDDRLIYVLAQKSSLGLDGSLNVKQKLNEWENSRFQYAHFMLKEQYGITDMIYGNMLSRVSSNIFLKALLYNEELSDLEIEKEIKELFRMILEVNQK